MKHQGQSVEQLLSQLSSVKVDSKDDFTLGLKRFLDEIPDSFQNNREELKDLLTKHHQFAQTFFRLSLGMSKDEFQSMTEGDNGVNLKRFRKAPEEVMKIYEQLGLFDSLQELIDTPVTWRNIIYERLVAGRGSAIKGQKRGRNLEDIVEHVVKKIFGEDKYEVRCQFIGKNGLGSAKADFAIPNKTNAEIVIEVKAYGSTGSKQSDVIGDLEKIANEKKHTTTVLFFTDGPTWNRRRADFERIVKMQNEGYIRKIYTQQMLLEFENDLVTLKNEHRIE